MRRIGTTPSWLKVHVPIHVPLGIKEMAIQARSQICRRRVRRTFAGGQQRKRMASITCFCRARGICPKRTRIFIPMAAIFTFMRGRIIRSWQSKDNIRRRHGIEMTGAIKTRRDRVASFAGDGGAYSIGERRVHMAHMGANAHSAGIHLA